MKKLLFYLLAILLLTACDKDPIAPADTENGPDLEFRVPQNSVAICHKKGNGTFMLKYIPQSALSGHLNHGDYLVDADGDGYTVVGACAGSANDCDDNDPYVHPGAMEICGNFIDDNCNGQVDEGCCDDQDYSTIVLNGKTWLAENLEIEIPGFSWWYNNDPENFAQYGRLYTWEAAQAACGALGACWRLPTIEEWDELKNSYSDDSEAYYALIEGGDSGLDLALAGIYHEYFSENGAFGMYWSSTEEYEHAGSAWSYSFNGYTEELNKDDTPKWFGSSCRCIKD